MLAIVMTFIMVAFFNAAAMADELSDKQQQYNQSLNNIDDLKGQKADLREDIAEDQKKLKAIDVTISGIDTEIAGMQSKIGTVQKDIDVTTEELDQAIEEYDEQDKTMKKRINALYKNGTSMGYIEVILEATSFADFITRADVMQKIVDYDMKLLEDMKAKRDEINNKKVKLEKDKAELVALKNNLDAKKKQYEAQKQERKNVIALLDRKLSAVNSALAQEEAAAQKILKEIASLQNYKGNFDGTKYAILHKSDFPSGKSPYITSYFGSRVDPITGVKGAYHSGLDIGTARLTNIPIYSMAPGKVVLAKWYGGYGNAVIIDHGSGLQTLYAHANKLLVSQGQTVAGGQKIALSGSTGRSTGPHLHFGVIKNGQYIDPQPYYLLGN